MPDEAKMHYRCIIPLFPRAKISIFVTDDNGDLEFKGIKKDPNFIDLSQRGAYGNVYNKLAPGDSGGPIMRKIYIDDPKIRKENQEQRNVIVAIISSGYGVTEKRDTKCIDQGTKVTQEMIQWIKKLDSGDYSLGK